MSVRIHQLLGAGTSALLAIDIQNDYIHPEGSVGRGGRDTNAAIAMMPRLHRLIAAARESRVPVYFSAQLAQCSYGQRRLEVSPRGQPRSGWRGWGGRDMGRRMVRG